MTDRAKPHRARQTRRTCLELGAGLGLALVLAAGGCSSGPGAESDLAGAGGVDAAEPAAPGFGENPSDNSPRVGAANPAAQRVHDQIALYDRALNEGTIELDEPPVDQAAGLPERTVLRDLPAPRERVEQAILTLAGEQAVANPSPSVEAPEAADEDEQPLQLGPVLAEATIAYDESAERANGMPRGTPLLELPAWMTTAEKTEVLTEQLAMVIGDAGERDLTPVPSMTRLAVLDLFRPGVFESQHPLFASQADAAAFALSDDDMAFITAWRDLFADLRGRLDDEAVDLDALAGSVERLHEAMERWRPLRIETAALCTKVDGFGVYAPIRTYDGGRYKFLAGRSHPVIVYVEVGEFGHTPIVRSGIEGFEVELKQTLTLYHAGTPKVEAESDLVAWRTEPQVILDFSRREREDFFVVQIVTLPKSLSVGSYRLKVAMDDPASGSIAEAIIDIDVVADLSAFESGVAVKN